MCARKPSVRSRSFESPRTRKPTIGFSSVVSACALALAIQTAIRHAAARTLLGSALEHEHHDFVVVLVGGRLIARGGDELPTFCAAAVELFDDVRRVDAVTPSDRVDVVLEFH